MNKKINKLPNESRERLIRVQRHLLETQDAYKNGVITSDQLEIFKDLLLDICSDFGLKTLAIDRKKKYEEANQTNQNFEASKIENQNDGSSSQEDNRR